MSASDIFEIILVLLATILILIMVGLLIFIAVDTVYSHNTIENGNITEIKKEDLMYQYIVQVPDGRVVVHSVNWYDMGSNHSVIYKRTGFLHLPYSDGAFV